MRRSSALKAALVIVAGGIVMVAYGVRSGEPQPTLHDPLGVLVLDGGRAVNIALGSCSAFDVTEVRMVASGVQDGITSDKETIIWKYRPLSAKQRVFHTSDLGAAVLIAFKPLGSFPKNDVFGIYVYYNKDTAPKGFDNRRALTKSFNLTQSSTEKSTYVRMAKMTC